MLTEYILRSVGGGRGVIIKKITVENTKAIHDTKFLSLISSHFLARLFFMHMLIISVLYEKSISDLQ